MDRDVFWKIIDDARQATGDIEQVPEEIVSQLCKLPVEEIISFKQHQLDLEAESSLGFVGGRLHYQRRLL